MAREGVPLNVIQRQLGHSNLGVTSVYLQGIDSAEVINAIHNWRPDDARRRRTDPLTRQRPRIGCRRSVAEAASWPVSLR